MVEKKVMQMFFKNCPGALAEHATILREPWPGKSWKLHRLDTYINTAGATSCELVIGKNPDSISAWPAAPSDQVLKGWFYNHHNCDIEYSNRSYDPKEPIEFSKDDILQGYFFNQATTAAMWEVYITYEILSK
ncbi:hypothetical protein ES703_116900 [subsurface metagenome]